MVTARKPISALRMFEESARARRAGAAGETPALLLSARCYRLRLLGERCFVRQNRCQRRPRSKLLLHRQKLALQLGDTERVAAVEVFTDGVDLASNAGGCARAEVSLACA